MFSSEPRAMNSRWLMQTALCESNVLGLGSCPAEPGTETISSDSLPEFEEVVERYYRPLYQFAFSLARGEAEAADLTQQTFYTWRTKGWQLRDSAKVRAWLFTTLHRAFLQSRRRQNRFPHFELSAVNAELPNISPLVENGLDSEQVLLALDGMDEVFRAPVALYYLEDCPYKEIASILNIPLGTVKSRISRGIAHLQTLLLGAERGLDQAAA